jgi:hypothetical protein
MKEFKMIFYYIFLSTIVKSDSKLTYYDECSFQFGTYELYDSKLIFIINNL